MHTGSSMCLPDPWVPHTAGVEGGKTTAVTIAGGAIVGAVNSALYVPVVFPCDATLYALSIAGTNTTGNYDLGFYDAALNRIASKGSTAMAAAILTLTLPELRVVGGEVYYAAASFSSASANIVRVSLTIAGPWRGVGVGLQTTAHPLPNPAVPGSPAASTTIPLFAFGVR